MVLDEHEKILVVKEKTRKQKWLLPGGEVERGESPRHAAQSETEEETGVVTDEADFLLIGAFVQRPKGVVFLYETRHVKSGIHVSPDSTEAEKAEYMSFEEVIEIGEDGFRTAYLRMILRWKRCQLGIDKIPYEGRLSDRVEFPRHLIGNYSDIVLTV
ncbi:MAG: NUDIX hydrolase [Candidatus Zambryskibacteria bacterium]|nr:NUDIX hydrolase [Candidatus Zambryskibacteria bacterium]